MAANNGRPTTANNGQAPAGERPTCKTCPHWDTDYGTQDGEGACWRYPPRHDIRTLRDAIRTGQNNSCGEHPAFPAWYATQRATPREPVGPQTILTDAFREAADVEVPAGASLTICPRVLAGLFGTAGLAMKNAHKAPYASSFEASLALTLANLDELHKQIVEASYVPPPAGASEPTSDRAAGNPQRALLRAACDVRNAHFANDGLMDDPLGRELMGRLEAAIDDTLREYDGPQAADDDTITVSRQGFIDLRRAWEDCIQENTTADGLVRIMGGLKVSQSFNALPLPNECRRARASDGIVASGVAPQVDDSKPAPAGPQTAPAVVIPTLTPNTVADRLAAAAERAIDEVREAGYLNRYDAAYDGLVSAVKAYNDAPQAAPAPTPAADRSSAVMVNRDALRELLDVCRNMRHVASMTSAELHGNRDRMILAVDAMAGVDLSVNAPQAPAGANVANLAPAVVRSPDVIAVDRLALRELYLSAWMMRFLDSMPPGEAKAARDRLAHDLKVIEQAATK